MKCIVKDCTNHEHEGRFSGDLCFPCFRFIATGEGVHSQAYRNVQKAVAAEREECAKIADNNKHNLEMLTSLPLQSGAARCIADAIRARGEK